jgi:ribosomal protein L11 methyltransferase
VTDDYGMLVVRVDPAVDAGEAIANFLWESGAVGVVEELTDPVLTLRAYFPPGRDLGAVHRAATGYLEALRSLAVLGRPGLVEAHTLPVEPWADAWRAHFRPIAIGRRLLVRPPWAEPDAADSGRLAVVIEPGRAFGTGGHATTRGCLELLERTLDAGMARRALDVGTGSGILAIAAARLGVPAVTAIDLDPDAVAAARANAERNGVAMQVDAVVADFRTWREPAADLVLANLLGATHVAHAGALASRAVPGGRLIAGGILVHEVPAVVGAFVPEGCALTELVEHEGWASLGLVRAGA